MQSPPGLAETGISHLALKDQVSRSSSVMMLSMTGGQGCHSAMQDNMPLLIPVIGHDTSRSNIGSRTFWTTTMTGHKPATTCPVLKARVLLIQDRCRHGSSYPAPTARTYPEPAGMVPPSQRKMICSSDRVICYRANQIDSDSIGRDQVCFIYTVVSAFLMFPLYLMGHVAQR